MAESWPRESDATVAVEAAARKVYEDRVAERINFVPPGTFPDFDDLPPRQKLAIREGVLTVVWAALSALPDPRHEAWAEGHATAFASPGTDNWCSDINPYPSGV